MKHAHEISPSHCRTPNRFLGRTLPLRDSAFTLIELICVVVILAVLAALTVPRMLNTGTRAAENESRAVQRLLSVASEKSGLWPLPVAIDYADNRLTLWKRRSDSADSVGASASRWTPDPLTEPVTLTNTQIRQAIVDGIVQSRGKWRVEFAPGQPRPVVVIALEQAALKGSTRTTSAGWEVRLDREAPGVSRVATGGDDDARPSVAVTRSTDLDDAGKGTAPW